MRMDRLALDYLRRAGSRLIDAESAFKRGDYPEIVRYSQEAVELSLKAVLRILGIEYPKVHEVSDILLLYRDNYPEWFSANLDRIMEISKELALKRAPAMYGIEASGKTPSDLFDEDDAEEALKSGRYVHDLCRKFIEEFIEASDKD